MTNHQPRSYHERRAAAAAAQEQHPAKGQHVTNLAAGLAEAHRDDDDQPPAIIRAVAAVIVGALFVATGALAIGGCVWAVRTAWRMAVG